VFLAACAAPASIPSTAAGVRAASVEATVLTVADGDSFRATMAGEEVEIRLLGVNAPELDECQGEEARDWLAGLIEDRTISVIPLGTDQFDRSLALVTTDDISINEALVAAGYGVVLSGDFGEGPDLLAAEEAARLAGEGIWGEEICGASEPKAAVVIIDIDYDPPGQDLIETIVVGNQGSNIADLSGFVLRDESSVNRFELPPLILAPGEEVDIEVSDCSSPSAAGSVAWCSDGAVWNNDGDTALLLDQYGRIVSMLRY
jgi:endonuclease YncB( thermonuclease family)